MDLTETLEVPWEWLRLVHSALRCHGRKVWFLVLGGRTLVWIPFLLLPSSHVSTMDEMQQVPNLSPCLSLLLFLAQPAGDSRPERALLTKGQTGPLILRTCGAEGCQGMKPFPANPAAKGLGQQVPSPYEDGLL